jgi:hypothetical protein
MRDDNDDDGDGVTGDDDNMATGDNGLRCACSGLHQERAPDVVMKNNKGVLSSID